MGLVEKIVAQFAHPTGLWGNIAGLIMAKRPSNIERNEWAISLLQLKASDRVLEIGFGPGVAIQKMSEIVTDGVIWGIDHSDVMLNQATKRNQRAISNGTVRLALASVSHLPSFDGQFNKILDVNGFQFWHNKVDALKGLREHLFPGGILALAHQPRSLDATEDDATEAGERFTGYLKDAGFGNVELKRKVMRPVSTICALGTNIQ